MQTEAMEQDTHQMDGDYEDLLSKSLEVGGDLDKKPIRHYWSQREEECFFEIWGRDNWRLTRHGKNTIFFGNWADELKQRFNIDVKPEEIQAKVNQTRAKFRQVKKQLELDKTSVRWKKFDIIGKILRNQYRPKDAEPVPPEALERNRDYSPTELSQLSPTSVTSNSNAAEDMEHHNNGQTFTDPNASNTGGALYNNSNNTNTNYTVELFADTDIKEEYDFDIKDDPQKTGERYQGYQYQQQPQQQPHAYVSSTDMASDMKPELHELQTPQQQQQQQQQQYHSQQSNYAAAGGGGDSAPSSIPLMHTSQPQSQSQSSSSVVNNVYEHASNAYGAAPVAAHLNENVNVSVNAAPASTILTNNQNHYGNGSSHQTQQINTTAVAAAAAPAIAAAYNNHGYNNVNANSNSTNNTTNVNNTNNGNGNGNSIMQPPRPAPQPRRRRAPSVSATFSNNFTSTALATQSTENFESLYMEEVRKKNFILAEHNEIERKRLQLEERKVALLEQFLPNCLDMQEKILRKLGTDT